MPKRSTTPLSLLRAPGAQPKLVGHRGACDVAPENTLPSFQRALDDGADLVEMDVRLTLDRRVVVMHDGTVDRTTDGTGTVAEMTLAEVQRLDAGAWFAPQFAGTCVPSLDEVLAWGRDKVGMMLELKSAIWGGFDPDLAPAVVGAVRRHAVESQVVFISYQTRSLCQVRDLLPGASTGPMFPGDRRLRLAVALTRRWPALARWDWVRGALLHPLRQARAMGCTVVGLNVKMLTPTLVQAAHAVKMPVSPGGFAWDYAAAIRMGVDTVSSNDPGRVRRRFLE
jgi:glycerophosphoryl diester phosphodiesterase